jgi:5-formyltetrahydrofolate cyclo-ligase
VNVSAHKQIIRRDLRALRRALTPAQRAAENQALCDAVWHCLHQHTHALASFLALPDEPDLADFHRRWWELNRPVWLPRVCGPGQMTWHAVRDLAHTIPGSYGIREPDPALAPAELLPTDACILVPGVAFTRDGRRLGQGMGFYDRVLVNHRGPTIGIAFRCQLLDDLPTEPHDQRLHRVFTAADTSVIQS